MDPLEKNIYQDPDEEIKPEAVTQEIEEVTESVPEQPPVAETASSAEEEPAMVEAAPEAAEEPQSETAYHGAGAGRKESPFANSPYEMPHRPEEPISAAPQKMKEKKSHKGLWKKILAASLALVVVAGSCVATALIVNAQWQDRVDRLEDSFEDKLEDLQKQIEEAANKKYPTGNPIVSTNGMSPAQIYAQNISSVVLVKTTIRSGSQVGYSTGSGFVITQDGYIVTNYHVVEGGTAYAVVFADGTEYTAALQGGDETNDVAVLKINATGLNAVKLGNSSDLIVGDQVVAIGNPLGTLTSTLTVGYVSGKDRDVDTDGNIINMIQTDAAINSGNSGGPLFNTKGEVVGITTAKYSGQSSSGATIEGIGFAIPVDDVKKILVELLANGYVSTPYMGVYIRDTGDAIGVYVESVEPGSSALAAGVKPRDIIVALGDQEITTVSELTRAVRNYKVGDTTTITVFRGRQLMDLNITFGEKPRDESATPPASGTDAPENGSYEDWYDFFFGQK
jgi:serine protease Do